MRRWRRGADTPGSRDASAPAGAEGHGVTPLEARTGAFELAVRAARATGEGWSVIPSHGAAAPVVVVPQPRRAEFLRALERESAPAWLRPPDPGRDGGPLLLEPWSRVDGEASLLGSGCEVVVEFWEAGADGDLHHPDRGAYTPVIPTGALADHEVLGVTVPVHPVLATPTVTDCTLDVDVVFTWVDGADPDWDERRRRRLAAADDAMMRSAPSSGRARYLNRDELRYSMRGIHLFAPWVRTIHLVTDQQVPPWLDADHPRVNLVDHREILPADALPTFNSQAIEAALHRIDGLAEHFLYLNDDVFLARPSGRETWFTGAGANRVFLSHTTIGLTEGDPRPWLVAAHNNRRLLQQTFGRTIVQALKHAPYPHRRSVLEEIEARFPAEVGATARAPFRSATDLSLLSSFAQYYGLAVGTAVLGELDSLFVDLTHANLPRPLRSLLQRDRASFCLGEGEHYARAPEEVDALVSDFLPRYFPISAPWER